MYNTQAIEGQSMQMFRYLVVQGHYRTIKSQYASQEVIVCKKLGEIHLCVNYHKLNSITVRDTFLLPQIDKALQADHLTSLRDASSWPWRRMT